MARRAWFAAQVLFDLLAFAVFAMLVLSMALNYSDMETWPFRMLTLAVAAWALLLAARGAMKLRDRFRP